MLKHILCFLVCSTIAYAQYRGNEATDVAVDSLGHVYATGRGLTLDSGNCLTAKISQNGHKLWANYSNCGNGENKLAVGKSGNIYLAGLMATIKYNSQGVELWNVPNFGYAKSVAIDKFENVYVVGSTKDAVHPTYDANFFTAKYDSNGTEEWIVLYDGPGDGHFSYDEAIDIAVDNESNIYVTGYSYSNNGYDYATVKYDSDGIEKWVNRYDGSRNDDDTPYDLDMDTYGNIYITGRGYEGPTRWDYTTVKYDSHGALKWAAEYDGPGDSEDEAYSLAVDDQSNVYVTGRSREVPDPYKYRVTTIKYDSTGSEQWTATYEVKSDPSFGQIAVAVDNCSNAYVTSIGTENYQIVKYNFNGIVEWITEYGPTYAARPKTIFVDRLNYVYVGGSISSSSCTSHFVVMKYDSHGNQKWEVKYECSPLVNVEAKPELPAMCEIHQPFPNPFNATTTIELFVSIPSFVNISVYDISGKRIETIFEQKISAGHHTITWDAIKRASGLYFIQMISDRFKETRKVLLLK
jgi:hypothetical protein